MTRINKKNIFIVLFLIALFVGYFFLLPMQESSKVSYSTDADSVALQEYKEVQKVFDQRCIACHSCYNAACQLKLTSFEGIDRGLHPSLRIYDNKRTEMEEHLTRLFTDAQTTKSWREDHGFVSILDNVRGGSVLEKVLLAKVTDSTDPKTLPLSEDLRQHQCINNNAAVKPMPYGLPALSDDERNKVVSWVKESVKPSQKALDAEYAPSSLATTDIVKWEEYLNRADLKSQLIARYVYEHLFISHIYFDKRPEFFNLIRSSKACNEKIEIPSRRPYEDPKGKVYYCFNKIRSTIVHKTHITYELSDKKLARFKELFESNKYGDWTVEKMPSYEIEQASNPFITFEAIPANARYQFLLDDSEHFVRTFIRGPVCRGNTAVNVINEQFYVMFVDPSAYESSLDKFVKDNKNLLGLPAQYGSSADSFSLLGDGLAVFGKPKVQEMKAIANIMLGVGWLPKVNRRLDGRVRPDKGLSGDRIKYRDNRLAFFKNQRPNGYQMSDIWNGGEEKNQNALLTVLRHYDSASVTKGAIGPTPKTMWLMDYPLLEGIYYNLVAGFDVYGDAGHQASTRYYKSSQRFDGEEHFLHLVPKKLRKPMRDSWYQDGTDGGRSISKVTQKWYPIENVDHDPVPVVVPQAMTDLREVRKEIFAQIYDSRFKGLFTENTENRPVDAEEFSVISGKEAKDFPFVQFFPDVSYVKFKKEVFSLVRNKEHYNVTWAQDESLRLNKGADILFATRGIVGSYPIQFFDASSFQTVEEFAVAISNIKTKRDYEGFFASFGIDRTSEQFWPTFDFMVESLKDSNPIEAGVFDLNRYGVTAQ